MKNIKGLSFFCAAFMAISSIAYLPAVNAADNDSVSTDTAYEGKYQLSNPDANENTQRIYDYICDHFGSYILSGQQESTWMDDNSDYEMDYIQANTGKLPAIRGLDFMSGDFDGCVERAKEWSAKGGIVTICWHTGVYGDGYQESLNDNPDFSKLLNEETTEYKNMIANWDLAADALKELQDAGVTVLWRPFHEFDGQWFWWGKGGAENFKTLWKMMYDRFTNTHGLNNLIWVLGYADDVKSGWYPGDDYCDIIGSDTYRNDRLTNKPAWNNLQNVTDADKPLAFHECGNLPTVSQFESDGCIWSWFMVWHTSHITGNNKSNLNAVYNSERVITLDELPDLTTYVSGEVQEPLPESSSEASSDSSIISDDASSTNTDSEGESNIENITSNSSGSSSSDSSSKAQVNSSGSADNSPATGFILGYGLLAVAVGAIAVTRKKK